MSADSGSVPVTAPSPGIRAIIAAAFRQNRLACLLLNLLVALLVASYYFWPPVKGMWEAVGAFKTEWSWLFSFISTAVVAGVLPFVIQSFLGTLPARHKAGHVLWLSLFWGCRGVEIDLFYRFQGWLFGHGNDAGTLAMKVAVDQFVYTPVWAVPVWVLALRLVENGGSWARTRASMDRAFFTRTFPALLITNWVVWIPAVALVYSLPAALQFPLFSVIMCFYILLVTLMARGEANLEREPLA